MTRYTDYIVDIVTAKSADKKLLKAEFDNVNNIYGEAFRLDRKKEILDKLVCKDSELHMLEAILKRFKSYDIPDLNELVCEAGYEGCDHDDFESMSDDCKQQRAEDHNEGMHDTFD